MNISRILYTLRSLNVTPCYEISYLKHWASFISCFTLASIMFPCGYIHTTQEKSCETYDSIMVEGMTFLAFLIRI